MGEPKKSNLWVIFLFSVLLPLVTRHFKKLFSGTFTSQSQEQQELRLMGPGRKKGLSGVLACAELHVFASALKDVSQNYEHHSKSRPKFILLRQHGPSSFASLS